MKQRRLDFPRMDRPLVHGSPNCSRKWKETGNVPCLEAAQEAAAGLSQFDDTILSRNHRASSDQRERQTRTRQSERSEIAVMLFTVGLFILGCGYAGLAGYLHATIGRAAWLCFVGTVAALTTAMIGLWMTASPVLRQKAWPFMSCAASLLLGGYAALLVFGLDR